MKATADSTSRSDNDGYPPFGAIRKYPFTACDATIGIQPELNPFQAAESPIFGAPANP